MSTKVQRRRGTTAEHSTFTGAAGELTVDTDKDVVVVHDGTTAGGYPMLRQDQANLPTSTPSNGVYLPSANNVAISTSGTGRLFIDANGKVGIAAALQVAGAINTLERTVTAGAFDMDTGNHWTCGAITVPAPTNATAGTSGLIRITAGPVVWNAVFKFPGGTAPTIASFPAIIPFYVQTSSVILMGNVAEGIA